MTKSDNKIEIENVNAPGRLYCVDEAKYADMQTCGERF